MVLLFPPPYLWAQAVQAVMLERMVDCNKGREDVAQLINLYLGGHEFFGISL